jgi:hypothetical protein
VVRVLRRSQSKKLRQAGARWAGERVVDQTADDLKAFAAPAAVLEQAAPKDDDFEVWEDNWPAVEMFLRAQTQWVFTGMGEAIGLHYPSLDFLFKIYRVKDRKQMLEDIREIEAGALLAMRKDEEKSGV